LKKLVFTGFFETINYSAWLLIVRLIQEMAVAETNKSDTMQRMLRAEWKN
jgi:hypothetical protein